LKKKGEGWGKKTNSDYPCLRNEERRKKKGKREGSPIALEKRKKKNGLPLTILTAPSQIEGRRYKVGLGKGGKVTSHSSL